MPKLTNPVELTPGTFITGEDCGFYEQFLGIPFAKPPLGPLRFRNPESFPLWTGNRLAVTASDMCWQYDAQLGTPVSGSEDCLYLNLFRPKSDAKREKREPLNVIAFIHGGGFYSGTNNPCLYGPDYFMETGVVILVTIAYRVNVFGFLATGDEASPGNYGLKDQVMALRWVRDNVAAFGGNPDALTLMGQSAGSISVNYHLMSQQSEGLFKNVIMLAGVAKAEWGVPLEEPREFVNRHARALRIVEPEKLSSAVLVEIMRSIPARDLVESIKQLKDWDILPITSYLPSVEPKGTVDPFLTVHPREAMQKGDFSKVPVLVDLVPFDGINFIQPMLTPEERYREFNERMHTILPVILYMNPKNRKMPEIVNKVKAKYFGPTGRIEGDRGLDKLQRLATDYLYAQPLYWTMQQLAEKNDKKVFGFIWNYTGQNSFAPIFTKQTNKKYDTAHADELLHMFRIRIIWPENQLSEEDEMAKDLLMKHVLNFVKNDDPGFEEWKDNDPKMALFKNDSSRVITSNMVSMRETLNDLQFWDDIRKLYEDGGEK